MLYGRSHWTHRTFFPPDGFFFFKGEAFSEMCWIVNVHNRFSDILLLFSQVGPNQMHSMYALHLTNWSSRIIKVLGVRSGSTLFWMKHRILRTLSPRDGSCCSIFRHKGNIFNSEVLKSWIFKLMAWKVSRMWCIVPWIQFSSLQHFSGRASK